MSCRSIFSSVAIVACAGIYAFAAERATFILTDGGRKSGTVVYHGDQHENLINGFLNLGVDNGTEMTFPLGQVAVIDFVGGQPPTTELAQLGTDHMLVTRDGATQQGRLINLTGGETLFWENLAKQRQQFAIRDVSRVYLNPQSARTTFGYTAPAPAPVTPAIATQDATRTARNRRNQDPGARGITIRVDPRQEWTDSGLTVNRGERLLFEAGMPVRGLLGRIGNGASFVIGTEAQPIEMRASGRLMLGVSDDEGRGNLGPFSVMVSRP